MATIVTGEQYYDLDGKLGEIKRQLRQKGGYPFNIIALEKHLQDAIEGRFNMDALTVGKLFMTVKLGQYSTIDVLRKAITTAGKKISRDAKQILGKITISAVEEEIDLWEVTGAELGFTEVVSRKDIYKRAVELGFAICPAEAIALARIQYNDGKWRIGGMESITGSNGGFFVFHLSSDGDDLYFDAGYGFPNHLWDPGHAWLFARPRRK
jgi:hypothetical protein